MALDNLSLLCMECDEIYTKFGPKNISNRCFSCYLEIEHGVIIFDDSFSCSSSSVHRTEDSYDPSFENVVRLYEDG